MHLIKFPLYKIWITMLRDLLIAKEQQLHNSGFISFTPDELLDMSDDIADKLISHFHGIALMKIPDEEIKFFDWLKKEDPAVWNDLWANEEDPYLVSIDLLKNFILEENGFPICDLIDEPNYWFTKKHLKAKSSEKYGLINKKIEEDKNLTVDEALLAEVSQASIDIWHFCYKYNYPVQKAKIVVRNMHRDDLLVHLSDREDLIKYLDV